MRVRTSPPTDQLMVTLDKAVKLLRAKTHTIGPSTSDIRLSCGPHVYLLRNGVPVSLVFCDIHTLYKRLNDGG